MSHHEHPEHHDLEDLHYVSIPVKDWRDRKTITTFQCPFLMPHEIYQYWVDTSTKHYSVSPFVINGHMIFRLAISAVVFLTSNKAHGLLDVSAEERARYWQHYKGLGLVSSSDINDDWVPLGLYGDEGRYSRTGEKIILFTMNSLLSVPRSTLQSHWQSL